MKKVFTGLMAVAMIVACIFAFAGCGEKTYEIAVVTDVGQLMDGGFNQGTWEGAKTYAETNGLTYKYYQPANGSNATDADRIAAMRNAISNGAKVIVAPGFLQANAMTTVALDNPGVKFVFIDGWTLTKEDGTAIPNITAVSYKEEESGYMAGYAAVMEGYTKLGATLGGGGSNPACNRFGFGYVQGAAAAAAEKNVSVNVKVSFQHGSAFSASQELQTQIAGWYAGGTEVVFSCGGSMFQSVKTAAEETTNGKIIGVDVDQSGASARVITSAAKGLRESVEIVLSKFYTGKWDAELAGNTSVLGASDNSTGLPTATWSMQNFSKDAYTALFNKIVAGDVAISTEGCLGDVNAAAFWSALNNANITVEFE